jgi:hypothetical protein
MGNLSTTIKKNHFYNLREMPEIKVTQQNQPSLLSVGFVAVLCNLVVNHNSNLISQVEGVHVTKRTHVAHILATG